ncbi:MAG TPA: D-alanyl-D-alanine carboxypeptidase/D-alanyl-D-alanine-endopeptidase [Gaiellaceae bacterium]
MAALALLVGLLSLVVASQAPAASLSARLSRALGSSGVSWANTSAFVANLSTGKLVYARGSKRALRPASNEKLLVALTALDRFGPGSRITTPVIGMGTRQGPTWRGSLFLKGYGDPTLTYADLKGLARKIRGSGIRRITGYVLGDESFFDKRRTAPGWKPSFYKEECPPLSALIVSRAKVGGYTTSYPALSAAQRFKKALKAAGVAIPHKARVGVAPKDGTILARSLSPGLAYIVQSMDRQSDNYYAEALLKRLGRIERGKGSTGAGARVVRNELAKRGIPLAGIRIADGSGLSSLDRVTARTVVGLLRSAWKDSRIRKAFFASLPRAGIDGTLKDRMERPPARGFLRAKTGTTNNASALSGYVGARYVFSVVQNGNPVPWTSSRSSQDRFGQILAAAAK